MRVTVQARGGFSVYGGHYDPHRNEAIVLVRVGETTALTIDYPDTPSAPALAASSGMNVTTPTVSGSKVTATLSGANDGGYADITASVSGETRLIRIRARSQTWIDRYESGLDQIGT